MILHDYLLACEIFTIRTLTLINLFGKQCFNFPSDLTLEVMMFPWILYNVEKVQIELVKCFKILSYNDNHSKFST